MNRFIGYIAKKVWRFSSTFNLSNSRKQSSLEEVKEAQDCMETWGSFLLSRKPHIGCGFDYVNRVKKYKSQRTIKPPALPGPEKRYLNCTTRSVVCKRTKISRFFFVYTEAIIILVSVKLEGFFTLLFRMWAYICNQSNYTFHYISKPVVIASSE